MREKPMDANPPRDERPIRTATTADAEQICSIYNHYVLNTTITFEEERVTCEDIAQRIDDVVPALPWLASGLYGYGDRHPAL